MDEVLDLQELPADNTQKVNGEPVLDDWHLHSTLSIGCENLLKED